MSVTQVNNIIIEQEDFIGEAGELLIDYTGQYVNLIMTAAEGYGIESSDFSWDGSPGNGVDSVSFSPVSGTYKVLCQLTINPTYEIPQGGISFPVCISGKATLTTRSLDTLLSFGQLQDVTQTAGAPAGEISTSGNRGSTTTNDVLDVTLTAAAGHRFPSTNSASYNISNRIAGSTLGEELWTVTETWNQDYNTGDYTSYRVQANYTFPNSNASFSFNVAGAAEEIPAPPLSIDGFGGGDFSSIGWKGGTRSYIVLGSPTATFSFSLQSGSTVHSSGTGVIDSLGECYFQVAFPQVASASSTNYTLNITATNTSILDTTSFAGSSNNSKNFTITQSSQDTVFITRNVTVKNSDEAGGRVTMQGWVPDGLGFGYTKNGEFIKKEYPMADTLSSPGVFATFTEVFEVPISTDIIIRIGYTQKETTSPTQYFLRSIVTGMASGNVTTDVTVPGTTEALGDLGYTVQSPGAGTASAGVINLYAQDTSF